MRTEKSSLFCLGRAWPSHTGAAQKFYYTTPPIKSQEENLHKSKQKNSQNFVHFAENIFRHFAQIKNFFKNLLTTKKAPAIIKVQTREENKKMTKDDMLTLVIRRFGFEHPYTVDFAGAMDWLGDAELEALFDELMRMPLDDADEEEE